MKLHLAFLQYPAIEFYSLSRSRSDRNRDSLIALAWLLETQNVLAVVLRAKLAGGVLGAECSRVDPPEVCREEHFSYMNLSINILSLRSILIQKSSIRSASSVVRLDNQLTNTQLASILHLNARVNLNLREIDELTRERGSLVSKIHAASINVSGLPHLNVSESALTKRLAMTNVDESSGDEEQRREFRDAGILLDTRAKWLRRRHAFLDWMVSLKLLALDSLDLFLNLRIGKLCSHYNAKKSWEIKFTLQ